MRSNLAGTEVTDIPCDRMEGGNETIFEERGYGRPYGGDEKLPENSLILAWQKSDFPTVNSRGILFFAGVLK
jgi:hypothetical protein